jgi:hypothetical protein
MEDKIFEIQARGFQMWLFGSISMKTERDFGREDDLESS